MKVRCKKELLYSSSGNPSFIEGLWYKIAKIGKNVSIVDHNGYTHFMGFNVFDDMFETQEEIRDSKIDSILNE